MKICIYGASSRIIDKKYIKAAESLGERFAKLGHTIIFGGGAQGIMGAVARGYKRGGGERLISVIPSFFNVDGALFNGATEEYYPDTMRERKMMLETMADVIVTLPGGIGTFDEFFEVITLKSLGVLSTPIALYNSHGFYNPMLDMLKQYESEGFLAIDDELFACVDSEDKLISYIETAKPAYLKSKLYKTV